MNLDYRLGNFHLFDGRKLVRIVREFIRDGKFEMRLKLERDIYCMLRAKLLCSK